MQRLGKLKSCCPHPLPKNQLLALVREFFQGEILYAPPPPFRPEDLFQRKGGGVYIFKPPAAGFYTPPPLLYAPHP